MEFAKGFEIAVQDYFDLLNKKYPQKAILKLVGDRYKLSRTERSMLYRGISIDFENKFRTNKLVRENSIYNQTLHVDGYNQIFTIASYLNGNVIFISTDGYLRDASEIHGKIFRSELLNRSVDLLLKYCQSLEPNKIRFYVDRQVNKHEMLIDYWQVAAAKNNFETIISEKVDKELGNLSSGIIATSDSQIIEKSNLKIFDLSHHTLQYHFNPIITNLRTLL